MIRLKPLLEQSLDIGEVPFGDFNVPQPEYIRPRLRTFLRTNEVPSEPNTESENQVVAYLNDYLTDESSVDPDARIAQLLQKLLTYKSKFPSTLDPATSSMTQDRVWRGTSLSLNLLQSYGFDPERMYKELQNTPADVWSHANPLRGQYSVNPRGKRGFFSFSAARSTATSFAKMNSGRPIRRIGSELYVHCVLGVPTSSPRVLFTPEFIHSIGGYAGEEECMYVGVPIQCDQIHVRAFTKEEYEEARNS